MRKIILNEKNAAGKTYDFNTARAKLDKGVSIKDLSTAERRALEWGKNNPDAIAKHSGSEESTKAGREGVKGQLRGTAYAMQKKAVNMSSNSPRSDIDFDKKGRAYEKNPNAGSLGRGDREVAKSLAIDANNAARTAENISTKDGEYGKTVTAAKKSIGRASDYIKDDEKTRKGDHFYNRDADAIERQMYQTGEDDIDAAQEKASAALTKAKTEIDDRATANRNKVVPKSQMNHAQAAEAKKQRIAAELKKQADARAKKKAEAEASKEAKVKKTYGVSSEDLV